MVFAMHSNVKPMEFRTAIIWLLGIFGVGSIALVYVALTAPPPPQRAEQKPAEEQPAAKPKVEEPKIRPGATVRLALDGTAVAVATDAEHYSRMIDRLNKGDRNALARMMVAGQMFSVKNGTKALVVDVGIFSTEVRILEGDHQGEHGLVKTSWIQP